MTAYVGEFAALGAAICWAFTSVFFSAGGRLVGSPVLNRMRLLFAVIIISVVHWATRGEFIPLGVERARWGWLALSGMIGFLFGDALLFQAYVMIGPRVSTLLMAFSPIFSVVLGLALLGEHLKAQEFMGVFLTVSGVMWVITARVPENNGTRRDEGSRNYALGLLCALGGALGQAGGLIASKKGLEGDFPVLSGSLIRLLAAMTTMWVLTIATGRARSNFQKLRANPRAVYIILVGSFVGPALGVGLSLLAVQKAPVGIASTLMSLTPIILLPISYVLYRERFGARTVFGTVLAVSGTAVIFLSG